MIAITHTQHTRVFTVDDGSEALQAIVEWEHHRGDVAHCLARALCSSGHSPVAVLSELRSNEHRLGLTTDPAPAAQASLATLPPEWEVDPAAVTWLLHHGEFSTPDPAGPEALTHVALRWDGQTYQADPTLADQTLLSRDDFRRSAARLRLTPVPEVLEALGWSTR